MSTKVAEQKRKSLRNPDGIYEWNGRAYPSVTTILDPYTPWLFVQLAAVEAEVRRLVEMEQTGESCEIMHFNEESGAWQVSVTDAGSLLRDPGHIKAAGSRKMAAAGDRGTIVHNAMELYANGAPWSPDDAGEVYDGIVEGFDYPARCNREDVIPYLRALGTWLMIHKPVVHFSEIAVFNDTHKYAGTMDLVMTLGDKMYAVDLKSTDSMSRSYIAQVAAYRHAEIALADREFNIEIAMQDTFPDMDLAILLVSPEKVGLRTITHEEGLAYFNEMFLPALNAWWANRNLPMPKARADWHKVVTA